MLFYEAAEARHIAGGEMSYEYLGPGSRASSGYSITIRLYSDCFAPPGALRLTTSLPLPYTPTDPVNLQ